MEPGFVLRSNGSLVVQGCDTNLLAAEICINPEKHWEREARIESTYMVVILLAENEGNLSL